MSRKIIATCKVQNMDISRNMRVYKDGISMPIQYYALQEIYRSGLSYAYQRQLFDYYMNKEKYDKLRYENEYRKFIEESKYKGFKLRNR